MNIRKLFQSKPAMPLPGYELGWEMEGSMLKRDLDTSREPIFVMFARTLKQFETDNQVDVSQLVHFKIQFQYRKDTKNET